jgi:DHA1 family bicyclomycin/chloramphenicol resistance-like MFS transporter
MTARAPSQAEFIGMIAILFAVVAFSIDAMLPALPDIAAKLSPADPNRAQLILSAFLFGMGAGTLVAGPLSDAIGRRSSLLLGFALYIAGAALAAFAQSLDLLLAARVIQGLGAAGPRIVSIAVVRDLHEGRAMARIMSFVMMVFILVPAVAPLIGAQIIAAFGWRAVFGAFVLFGLVASGWLALRLPETLAPERRRPFRAATLISGIAEVMSHRAVIIYIIVLTLGFGQMFALLSSTQSIFDQTYGRGAGFPLWFALIALMSASGSVTNASLVVRFGMRRLAVTAYAAQVLFSGTIAALVWSGVLPAAIPFPLFFFWAVSIFTMAGLTFGNLNALALQPLGHMAGLAASVVGALSTVLSVAVAVPIGLSFDGTPFPLIASTLACSALALGLMRLAPRQPAAA